jgi:predicted dehydrogenase
MATPINAAVLVVGFGSIGQRHVRVLRDLGCAVAVVSRHAEAGAGIYRSLPEALRDFRPGYCVLATATAEHAAGLADLAEARFAGPVLVEKPLAARLAAIPGAAALKLFVGYNLRFHPVIQALRLRLAGASILAAVWQVGQFLPDWRPGQDYRRSYSALVAGGGGVLRDLSHELDLLLWMFGSWQRLVATVQRSQTLAIETEDSASLLVAAERCPQVVLHLNYLNRMPVRQFTITTTEETWSGDLIRCTLARAAGVEQFEAPRDLTYRRQHEAVLTASHEQLCGADAGVAVGTMIDSIELSAAENRWIHAL